MPQTAIEINEVFEVANLAKARITQALHHSTIVADNSYEHNGKLMISFNRRTWVIRLVPGFYLTIKHGLTVTRKSRLKYSGKKWYETVLMTGAPDFETLRTMKREKFLALRQRVFDIYNEHREFVGKMEAMGEVGFGKLADLTR